MPLVLAEGAGAEMRRTLGMAVFWGMLGVTLSGPAATFAVVGTIDRLGWSRPELREARIADRSACR
jgi:hypothetical protein